jgi:hypothetical protein
VKGTVPWPQGDPQRVIREILKQAEYRVATNGAESDAHRTIWSLIREWIADHIIAVLRDAYQHMQFLSRMHGAARIAAILWLVVVGGVIAWLCARPIARLFASRRGRVREDRQEFFTERTAAEWSALSREEAAFGRYGAAVSALFMAALRLLDEHAVVAFDAARTPNEYRTRLRSGLSAASPAYDELAGCFVRAVYGSTIPEQVLYDKAASAYIALHKVVIPG